TGDSPASETGVYTSINGVVDVVADLDTPIPGGQGNFEGLYIEFVPIDNGSVAFRGFSVTEWLFGIYTDMTGPLSIVADLDTPMPGEGVNFGFLGLPHYRDGKFAFGGSDDLANPTQTGLYTSENGTLTKVVDLDTPIPDGTGTFANLFEPCFDGTHIAFLGADADDTRNLYTDLTGSLTEIIAVDDVLDGKTVSSVSVGLECLEGNQIAFSVTFTDGSRGVFVATYPGPLPGDVDGDGDVDLDDYVIFDGCLAGPLARSAADSDWDGDVDLDDFTVWQTCLAGPGIPAVGGCQNGDFDADTDVDLADFAFLQLSFTGPQDPISSDCIPADVDGDNDVDLADFADFQEAFVGP
ncbi:MAG: hypothetical protein GY778_18605, partial [bacterium]|nr:hypothetical protein [bacterium]